MTIVYYDPNSTMLAARTEYFIANKFGEDGGYSDTWVNFKLGPIPFPFPNSKERVRALRFHDLHHILTGYDTNLLGESEVAAWELGAGCKDYVVAWILDLGALGVWFLSPKRVFHAFLRGLRSRSLYGEDLDGLLKSTVREARERMGVPETAPKASFGEYALFVATVIAGTVLGTVTFGLMIPLTPIGLITNYLKARDKARGKLKTDAIPAAGH